MRNFDVYLKTQIHTADIYLRELALRTELTAYDRLVIYTQMAAMLLYKYAATKEYWTFSTDVTNAYMTLYNFMKLDAVLSSKSEAFSTLFAKTCESDVLLESKNAVVMTKLYTDTSTFIELSSQLMKTPSLTVFAKATISPELQTAIDSGITAITAYSGLSETMQFVNHVSGNILLYVAGLGCHSIATKAAVTYLTRYRRFSDMESLTFDDIKNMSISELVFITT